MSYRYFVTTDNRGEREVDKAEYVKTERAAGFRNSMGEPDEPATSVFNGRVLRGRMVPWLKNEVGPLFLAQMLSETFEAFSDDWAASEAGRELFDTITKRGYRLVVDALDRAP